MATTKKRTPPRKTTPTRKQTRDQRPKIYAAARRHTVVDAETQDQVTLTTLTVDQFVKALAETVISANAAQSNQISSQIGQQVSKQISEQIAQQVSKQISESISTSVGKSSSDLQSRAVVQSDVDVSTEERIRSTAAREDALIGYKSNVTDFLIGTDAVNSQRNTQSTIQRMMEASLNHFATTLSDERIHKATILGAHARHTDIAVEKQWVTPQENLADAIVGEVLKSIQVPPAATEGTAGAAGSVGTAQGKVSRGRRK